MIPAKLFGLLLGTLTASESVDELTAMRANALGHAAATNGDNSRVKLAQRALIERAYPEIVEIPKEEEEDGTTI